MVHPYPAEGPTDPSTPRKDDRTLYTYTNNRRIVEIWADDQAEADDKFQERFGFVPSKENRNA